MQATDVAVTELAGLQVGLWEKIGSGDVQMSHLAWFIGLTPEQRDALMEGTTAAPPAVEPPTAATAMLRCLSDGQEIIIPATSGTRCIAEASDVFAGYRDRCFTKKVGVATPATRVKVGELVRDATLAQMFDSLGVAKQRLSFTEDQIVTFCEKHRDWLRTGGYATFFLLEEDGNFFVARVDVGGFGRLAVDRRPLERGRVWLGVGRHRLVYPQL